jgi:ribosomal protein S27E
MRGGWLSDAGGEYAVSFLTPPGAALPPFAALMPNDELKLAGTNFIVTNLEEAMCIAGEGELPFAFGAGYPAQLVDLRSSGEGAAAFASIDYSETPPLFFVGESLPFADFHFANLRGEQAAKPAGVVKALQCPACGGAIGIHDKAVQSVACPSCLSVLDASDERLHILHKAAAAMRIEPLIALGSVGQFGGRDWTVIGFQQRVAGIPAASPRRRLSLAGGINQALELGQPRHPAAAVPHRPADDDLQRRDIHALRGGFRRDPLRDRRIHLEGQGRRDMGHPRFRRAAKSAQPRIQPQRIHLVARRVPAGR